MKTDPNQSRPNILLITCHDLGRQLGCYGRRAVRSPALDRLAAEGVLFANAFSVAPQCSPSRSALHTGKYPHANGMMGLAHCGFDWRLNQEEKHMAKLMRDHGYASVLVGVQHMTDNPLELGYEQATIGGDAVVTAEIAAAELSRLTADSRPFYLEVGFFEPHRPFHFGGAEPDDEQGIGVPGYLPDDGPVREDFAALQGAIRALDAGVGVIMDALRVLELEHNTWVIFTTDHGIAMPWAKCTLYDPGIEVALLMRWPAQGIEGGWCYDGLFSQVDVLPTLVEALGIPDCPKLQGSSHWPQLTHSQDSNEVRECLAVRAAIFAEKTFHTHYEPMRSIRTATQKLIVNLESGSAIDVPLDIQRSQSYTTVLPGTLIQRPMLELYVLAEDPMERNNVADLPIYTSVRKSLLRELRHWMEETGDPLLSGPIASPFAKVVLSILNEQ